MISRHKLRRFIACDLCADSAPEYFEMDEDGMATLLNVQRSHDAFIYTKALVVDRDVPEEAEESCSLSIIRIDP